MRLTSVGAGAVNTRLDDRFRITRSAVRRIIGRVRTEQAQCLTDNNAVQVRSGLDIDGIVGDSRILFDTDQDRF